MAQATFGSPIRKIYGEQVSLTTTASHLLFRPNYHEVKMHCSTAWRMGIAPKLAEVIVYHGSAYTNYTTQATNRDSATHVPLDAATTASILYLGTTEPTRGFYFNIGTGVNANAATLDVEYCSAIAAGVATFTDVAADSDGTTSGGATLAVDGVYTFTLPATVPGIITALPSNSHLHWYRMTPSATLSATVDLVDIIPICDTVNYGFEQAGLALQFSLNTTQNGAFEFDHTATGTLDIDWIMH